MIRRRTRSTRTETRFPYTALVRSPGAKRLDVGGVDRRAAPDADAGRGVTIACHVIGGLFAFQQRGHLLDKRKLTFLVEALDSMVREFEADRKSTRLNSSH